jgi:hypothetical protein
MSGQNEWTIRALPATGGIHLTTDYYLARGLVAAPKWLESGPARQDGFAAGRLESQVSPAWLVSSRNAMITWRRCLMTFSSWAADSGLQQIGSYRTEARGCARGSPVAALSGRRIW